MIQLKALQVSWKILSLINKLLWAQNNVIKFNILDKRYNKHCKKHYHNNNYKLYKIEWSSFMHWIINNNINCIQRINK